MTPSPTTITSPDASNPGRSLAVGGGAYDYIGYIGMLREKKWGLAGRRVVSREELDAAVAGDTDSSRTTIARAKQWRRAPLFDTAASFAFVILVTLLFAVLATLVLHSEMAVPANNDLLNEQEAFLSQLYPALRWVYRIGVFLAFIAMIDFGLGQLSANLSLAAIFGWLFAPVAALLGVASSDVPASWNTSSNT